MKVLLPLPFLFLFTACSNDAPQINQELSAKLVGEWRSVELKIDMPSYKNSDSLVVFNVKENNWESRFNIRPIRTFYKPDGTYFSHHFNLKDSLIFSPAGKWMIVGDSLHMIDTFPQRGEVYRYKIIFKNNCMELLSLEDCDKDGKADDKYYGKQQRYQPGQ